MGCRVSGLVSSVTREVCVGTGNVSNEICREKQCLIRFPSVLPFSRQTKANECSTIITICRYYQTSLVCVFFSSFFLSFFPQCYFSFLHNRQLYCFSVTWQCVKNIKSELHVLHNLCHTLETLPCSGTFVFGDPSQILSEQDGVMELLQTLIREIILFVFGSGHWLS